MTEQEQNQDPDRDRDPAPDPAPDHTPDHAPEHAPEQDQDPVQKPISHKCLADELGIEDIYDPMVGKNGKVFCTAGRNAPIAEFTDDCLILHPPQLPLDVSNAGEEFSMRIDARGILLDELGAPKKILAATFKGCPIYCHGEQEPATLKHYVVALAHDGSLHGLFYEHGGRLTTQDVYSMRNRSIDGDLSAFSEVSCDI
jgi:hypothetical protein